MAQSLQQFVEGLLIKASMDSLPDDFRAQYVQKLVSQLEERIGLRALQELDEEQLADFERLVKDKAAPASMFEFFQRHVRDFQTKMTKVMDEFGEEFVTHSLAVRKELQATPAT